MSSEALKWDECSNKKKSGQEKFYTPICSVMADQNIKDSNILWFTFFQIVQICGN